MWRRSEKVRRECVEGEEKKSGVCGRGKERDREVFDFFFLDLYTEQPLSSTVLPILSGTMLISLSCALSLPCLRTTRTQPDLSSLPTSRRHSLGHG